MIPSVPTQPSYTFLQQLRCVIITLRRTLLVIHGAVEASAIRSGSGSRNSALSATLLLLLGSLTLIGCGAVVSSEPSHSVTMTGIVRGGQPPVSASTILLYKVGTSADASTATNILTTTVTTSDGSGTVNANANAGNQFNQLPAGFFTITSDYSCSANEEVYLVALGGNPGLSGSANNTALSLMADLGLCTGLTSSTNINVNEQTTIASVAALAPFMKSYAALGYQAGVDDALFNAAVAEVPVYTNIATGNVPGAVPAGYYASSLEIATLGDALAPCVNSANGTSSACAALFAATTIGGVAPTDTIGAALNIIKNPFNNVCAIFNLPNASAPFQPTLLTCPTVNGWVLPIEPIAATPVISPASGSYVGTQLISITDPTPGATIYYTIDGTTPSFSSASCTSPCSFSESTSVAVRAMAAASGYEYSGYTAAGIASAAYTIGLAGPAAKLAFVVQPANSPVNDPILPVVTVAVEDVNGNIVSSAAVQVTLALMPAGSANLTGGGATVPAGGLATFNLSVDTVANGYTLQATSPGLTPAISAAFNITNPPLTFQLLAGSNNLVGIGSTLTGTLALDKVATSPVAVTFQSSNPGNVTVQPSITIPAGSVSNSFTYTGVAPGASTLTATATGYTNATQQITATNALISLGQLPTIAPGQTSQIALSLGVPAPANSNGTATDVTLTSSNTAIATVTRDNDIFPGLQIPEQNPQVTGANFGVVTIAATAPNYAPDVRTITVTLSASFPTSTNIPLNTPTNITLTLSAPAPAGGVTFALTSANTGTATVPATVAVPAGSVTVSVPVTGVSFGSTTISATFTSTGTPPVTVTASTTVVVEGAIAVANVLTGVGLYSPASATLSIAPTTPKVVTITSSSPSALLLTSPGGVGATSISFSGITTTGLPAFYVQGVSAAAAVTLTVSTPGYVTGTSTIQVGLPGFVFGDATQTFTTTTFSPATGIALAVAVLDPATLTVISYCQDPRYVNVTCAIAYGTGPFTVPVTSSNTAAGTISANPVFQAGSSVASTTFVPNTNATVPATSNIALGPQPSGFSATSQAAVYLQGVATVNGPTISVPSPVTGRGLTVATNAGFAQNPPAPVTVTITSSNPAVALLSTSPTSAGSASIQFASVTSSSIPTFYVLGISNGAGTGAATSTLTVSAAGYTPMSGTISVYPSGFIIAGYDPITVNTTTFSGTASISAAPAILNPTTLTVYSACGNPNYVGGNCLLNFGTAPVSVGIASSSTTIGTLASNTITITPTTYDASTTFQPVSPGTETISLPTQPVGFTQTTDPNFLSEQIIVTAPNATISGVTTGVGLFVPNGASLAVAPPAPVTVTITSSNPAVARLTVDPAAVGTASIVFNNITGGIPGFYVQGVSNGSGSATATLTITVAGYNTGTATVTVNPTGFILAGYYPVAINTQTFSSPSTVAVAPAILNPTSLTVYSACGNPNYASGSCYLNPGLGSITVNLTNSNTAVGTLTSSSLLFTSGSYLASTTFKPLTAGTTSIGLPTQPAGFSTEPDPNYLIEPVTVTAPSTQIGAVTTGVGLFLGDGASLGIAPPSPVLVTITSSNPSVALISFDPTMTGTASISYTSSGSIPTFYVQGVSNGTGTATSTLTITAAGYNSATSTVTVDPSGFVFGGYSPVSIATTTFSGTSTVAVAPAILNPGTLTVQLVCGNPNYASGACFLNPNRSGVTVNITNSNPAVGTLANTALTFGSGSFLSATNFQPIAAGTTNFNIPAQPAGFTATSQINGTGFLTEPATVTAPNSSISAVTTGGGLYVGTGASLAIAPLSATMVTISISDPTVALLTLDPNAVGTASISFTTTSSGLPTFYVQGQNPSSFTTAKTANLTLTAPGYNSATNVVTVNPSGFVLAGYQPTDFTTTPFSSPTGVSIAPAILTSNSLNVSTVCGNPNYASGACFLNPGNPPVMVGLSNSNASAGTLASGSLSFAAASYLASTTFAPATTATGTVKSVISIPAQPAGFTATTSTTGGANYLSETVTVTAPAISVSAVTTGVGLYVADSASLAVAPPSAVNVTITAGAGALLSKTTTGVGSSSIVFSTSSTSIPTFYVQGGSAAASSIALTVQAPGYATATSTIAVNPSGFVFIGGLPISTTSLSGGTTLTLAPAILSPGTLIVQNLCSNGGCALNPGTGMLSVNIASTSSAVGTVSPDPVVFSDGMNAATTSFQPVGAGTTTLSLSQPAPQFTSTSSTNGTTYLSGLATVSAPQITLASSTLTTGVNLQVPLHFNLAQVPSTSAGGATITVTSSNAALLVVANSASAVGASSASFTGITSTNSLTVYAQGVATGTATLTFTSPGYMPASATVTIDPSGFVIVTPGFTAGLSAYTGSGNPTPVTIAPAILTPGTETFIATAQLSPGQGTLPVNIYIPSQPSCGGSGFAGAFQGASGLVENLTLNFVGGTTSQVANFVPQIANCSTQLTLDGSSFPAGFNYPSQMYEIPITVSP